MFGLSSLPFDAATLLFALYAWAKNCSELPFTSAAGIFATYQPLGERSASVVTKWSVPDGRYWRTTLFVASAGLAAQRMTSSVPVCTSEGVGQRSPLGKCVGRSGSGGGGGGGGGFFTSTAATAFAALAESDDCTSDLLLLGARALATCAAEAFFLDGAEVGRVLPDDVPHAGASTKKAQASKQCRTVSFKPTMASLRIQPSTAAKLVDSLLYERTIRRVGGSLEVEFVVAHGLGRIASLGIGHAQPALALNVLRVQLQRI